MLPLNLNETIDCRSEFTIIARVLYRRYNSNSGFFHSNMVRPELRVNTHTSMFCITETRHIYFYSSLFLCVRNRQNWVRLCTVYPKKYAHGFCFAVLCCGYTLTDFPTSIRLTSLALWQSNDCPSASKANLMNMDKYFVWINYERLHNHNKARHNKTVRIFLGMYCIVARRQHTII